MSKKFLPHGKASSPKTRAITHHKLDIDELNKVIRTRNIDKVRELISGVQKEELNQVGSDGNSPLVTSILRQDFKIMDLLLESGADPNEIRSDGRSLLQTFIYGKTGLALIKAGADPTQTVDRFNILHISSLSGPKDSVEYLLGIGMDPNIPTEDGQFPLSLAFRHPDIMKLLLEAGADPDIKIKGKSVYEYIPLNAFESVKIVREWKGLDPNEITKDGRNTFMDLIIKGYYPAFKKLLPEVHNINVQDKNGNTALHLAILHRRKQMLSDLLEQPSINLSIENKEGKTAFNYAHEIEQEDKDYLELLDERLEQQGEEEYAPGSKGWRLAMARLYLERDKNFLRQKLNKLDDETLILLAQIFALRVVGEVDRDDIIPQIRNVQNKMEKYLKTHPGKVEEFLESLADPDLRYTFKDISEISDENIESILDYHDIKSTGDRWTDLYLLAKKLDEEGNIRPYDARESHH